MVGLHDPQGTSSSRETRHQAGSIQSGSIPKHAGLDDRWSSLGQGSHRDVQLQLSRDRLNRFVQGADVHSDVWHWSWIHRRISVHLQASNASQETEETEQDAKGTGAVNTSAHRRAGFPRGVLR